MHERVHEHHADGGEPQRQVRHRREQPVHQRVHDAALLERHKNGPCEADQQAGVGHGPEARNQRVGGAGQAEPADQPRRDAHREEQGRHLVEAPALPHTRDEHDERGEHEREHSGATAVGRVDVRAGRAQRRRAAAGGIAQRARDPDAQGDHQERGAKQPPGEERQLRQLLRDAHLKRVEGAERRADGGGTQARGHGDDRSHAQPPGEQQHHRHERDDLFLHVVEHAAHSERERGHGNDQPLRMPETPHQPVDPVAQRPRLVHHGEGAPDQEHEEDHPRRVAQAARNRDQGLEGAHRPRRDGVVRTGHHDAATGGGIVAPVVFTRRQQVARERGDEHRAHQQRQGVGEPGEAHAGIMRALERSG